MCLNLIEDIKNQFQSKVWLHLIFSSLCRSQRGSDGLESKFSFIGRRIAFFPMIFISPGPSFGLATVSNLLEAKVDDL